jgi:hypothetical protein
VGNFLTRIVTIIALTCVLVAGGAVASILGRDSVPTLPPAQMTSLDIKSSALVPNREAKQDRLAAVSFATASLEPSQASAALSELRHAYASSDPADLPTPAVAAPSAMAPNQQKPKLAVKPQPQKQYALLSDAQIAGIKEHLNLSPEQESYWPAVENALRAVARKIHATRQVNAAGVPPIDPDAEEVQQLKSAAMPLLFQLREDQKNEVRKLARIIGLEKVAAQI